MGSSSLPSIAIMSMIAKRNLREKELFDLQSTIKRNQGGNLKQKQWKVIADWLVPRLRVYLHSPGLYIRGDGSTTHIVLGPPMSVGKMLHRHVNRLIRSKQSPVKTPADDSRLCHVDS